MQAQYPIGKEMNTLVALRPSSRTESPEDRSQRTKSRTLQIVQAAYGAEDAQMDVTQKVQAAIASGQTIICPSNSFFGKDPAVGKVKKFSASFVQGGIQYEITVREGELLSFASLERIIGSSWSSS